MKTILFTVLVTLSFNSFASETIKPCTTKDLKYLNDSIEHWKKEGYVNVAYMKNTRGETLGYYSWDKSGMHAELCEYIEQDELTVSNEWYYWGEGETSPKAWKKGDVYGISQDEGLASIKVLKASKTGVVTVEFSVLGWNSAVEEDGDIVVRKEIVRFER